MIKVSNLSKQYVERAAIDNISFEVESGEIVGFLGPNGAGKTTTLRSIVNLTKPSSGDIIFNNNNLKNLSTYKIAKLGLTLVPENRGMFNSLSVEESLNIVDINISNIKWNKERVLESFPQLKLKLKNNSSSLSGGEQQMLAISKALLTNPKLILLDEPTQGLAPNIVIQLTNIFKDIIKEGISLLIVEQNVNMALEIANHVTIVGKGETKWTGTKEKFLKDIQKHKEWIGI